MPLFSTHREPSPEVYEPERDVRHSKHSLFHRREEEPVVVEQAPKKHGIFHRKDETVPVGTHDRMSTHSSLSSHSSHGNRHSTGGGLLSKLGRSDKDVDPSILEARQRVIDAEKAEAEADRYLEQARMRVREAHAHMKRVEAEAEEDARRARLKQKHAREVTQRGKGLGREYLCSLFIFCEALLMCTGHGL